MNGMYPFYSNNIEKDYMSKEMLTFINDTLKENVGRKFITNTHVFFGNTYYEGVEELWGLNYTNSLVEMLWDHKDDMVINLGAHIHHLEIFAPIYEQDDSIYTP